MRVVSQLRRTAGVGGRARLQTAEKAPPMPEAIPTSAVVVAELENALAGGEQVALLLLGGAGLGAKARGVAEAGLSLESTRQLTSSW